MKKLLILLLALLLLCAACTQAEEPVVMEQPVSFYYRTAETDFSAEDGVIRAEIRDLGAGSFTERAIFELYFKGPQSPELISPVSSDTVLLDVTRRSGGVLEIRLRRSADSPNEFDHALTYACLAKTGFALDGVREVCILVSTPNSSEDLNITLRESDLLLYDSGTPADSIELTLYYADETGSFLLTEKRSVQAASHDELPLLALNELLAPPSSSRMRSALPPGTAVRTASVANGVCSVDFNGDFYRNRFSDEQAEQLTVLSVVNTLCELEGIEQVKLLVNGVPDQLSPYGYLDLSSPCIPDSTVVGPVRQELGEFSGTLCLPDLGDAEGRVRLHRLTVRARARGSALQEEALLLALFARSPQNGLAAPFAGAPTPISVKTVNGVCQVRLQAGTLPSEGARREQAIRSIVATLCTLPTVHAVELYEADAAVPGAPRSPNDEWFAASQTP